MNPRLLKSKRLLRTGAGMASVAALMGALSAGCLDRPVSPARPNVTNVFVDQINQNMVERIDLLFMIDNSLSMADKQMYLQKAVPKLVGRLISPNCVDDQGNTIGQSVNGQCPQGALEFTPVKDIHIGIVSSSLGGGGGPCIKGSNNPMEDDRGHLVATLRGGVPTYQNLGFLAWDPEGKGKQSGSEPGISDAAVLTNAFADMVMAVGEQGCGYEAGLEGWYRFLVDPEPPLQVLKDEAQQITVVSQEVDGTVLKQRAAFLRPDSLLAVIMLADENDCSIIDYGQGWLVAYSGRLPAPTSACAQDPNSPCCRSCAQSEEKPPSGCKALSADESCIMDRGEGPGILSLPEDYPNVRCWDTKRRFGFDLLFPIDRYVKGLTEPMVASRRTDSKGNPVMLPNPVMSQPVDPDTGQPVYPQLLPRFDSSLIYAAAIVGVPWQDIATEDTLNNPEALTYLTFDQLTALGRWDVILGNPESRIPPSDPFMIEQIDPRSGTNPITGQPIVPPGSTDPRATINGHEVFADRNNWRDDLQYACIFQLPAEMRRNCNDAEYSPERPAAERKGCDCISGTEERQRPLCQPPEGGNAGNIQHFAKGYPGLRYLEFLKKFGDASLSRGSIVASVCPKIWETEKDTWPAYGYNPAVEAIINRLKEKLKGACLGRKIVTNDDGTIACQVIEVTRPQAVEEAIGCATPGRAPLDPDLAPAILNKLKQTGQCGAPPKPACNENELTLCALTQAGVDVNDPDYLACINDTSPAPISPATGLPVTGYCYIDAMQDIAGGGEDGSEPDGVVQCDNPGDIDCIGNPELVKGCEESQRRVLRFISDPSNPVPAKNSVLILACKGASF